jgi:hypothetical protein
MYRVVLTGDGQELTEGVRVEADPVIGAASILTDEQRLPRRGEKKEEKGDQMDEWDD